MNWVRVDIYSLIYMLRHDSNTTLDIMADKF
jgi:hypothetical protein